MTASLAEASQALFWSEDPLQDLHVMCLLAGFEASDLPEEDDPLRVSDLTG